MLTTSTHDNKRSEDVWARISVLLKCPTNGVARFPLSKLTAATVVSWRCGGYWYAPSRNDEYLLYQTLLGIFASLASPGPPDGRRWPAFERMEDYMLKAGREAKVHSSWINSNPNTRKDTLISCAGYYP
jgi:(1->4)-alpha-D-glucan 1-alpha-D-glucosylmutase